MRYLKLYEMFKMPHDSKIQDPIYLIKEVESLSYIIEDDLPYYVHCYVGVEKNVHDFIKIELTHKNKNLVRNFMSTENVKLENSDEYEEFYCRIDEICLSVGCYLFSLNSPRYLYITNNELDKKILTDRYTGRGYGHPKSKRGYDILESVKQKDPILSEISHLKYLLEDEGYKLYYRKGFMCKEDPLPVIVNGKETIPSKKIIYFDEYFPEVYNDRENHHVLYSINVTRGLRKEIDEWDRVKFKDAPEYEEFLDRLKEACEIHGFKVDHMGHREESYDVFIVYQDIDLSKDVKSCFWFISEMTKDQLENLDKNNKLLESKSYNDKGVEDIIESLRYILEDDDYTILHKNCFLDDNGRKVSKQHKVCNPVTIINIRKKSSQGPNTEKIFGLVDRRKLPECEFYQEFYDRLSEECEEIGCYLSSPIGVVVPTDSSNLNPLIFRNGRQFSMKYQDIIVIHRDKNIHLISPWNYVL